MTRAYLTSVVKITRMVPEQDSAHFFREFYPRVHAFVRDATGAPHADVEDLVQETLLQAWRDRSTFRDASGRLSWILAIAKNRIRDLGRKRRSARTAIEILSALARIETEEIPENLLLGLETGQRVRGALKSLPPGYAETLVRHYVEGASVRDIAGQSGETDKAVESRLFRARQEFRQRLEKPI